MRMVFLDIKGLYVSEILLLLKGVWIISRVSSFKNVIVSFIEEWYDNWWPLFSCRRFILRSEWELGIDQCRIICFVCHYEALSTPTTSCAFGWRPQFFGGWIALCSSSSALDLFFGVLQSVGLVDLRQRGQVLNVLSPLHLPWGFFLTFCTFFLDVEIVYLYMALNLSYLFLLHTSALSGILRSHPQCWYDWYDRS